MDRKAILIVLVTVGAMLAWNKLYYSPLAEKDRQAFEVMKKSEAEKKAAEEKAKLAANPPATTPGTTPSQPGTTPATTTGTTLPPVSPPIESKPDLKVLRSVPGTVEYEFLARCFARPSFGEVVRLGDKPYYVTNRVATFGLLTVQPEAGVPSEPAVVPVVELRPDKPS